MNVIQSYSGQIVIVFGRDAYLPVDLGTGIETFVFLPRLVINSGMEIGESILRSELIPWTAFRKHIGRLLKPVALPLLGDESLQPSEVTR